MGEKKKKDIDTLLAESMVAITFTKSELGTLRFYLDKAIVDAEGMHAVGVASETSVQHLHAIRKKIAEKG